VSPKNAGMIHGTDKAEEKAKGKDNFILNVLTIALLLSFFVVWALAIYLGVAQYLLLVFFVLFCLLLLFKSIKEFFWPSKPIKHKESDDKLTCNNGHTVSVYVHHEAYLPYESKYDRDITCGASVWPEKCPICGAHWLRYGK
jgi:hypothetical protein